MKRREVLASIAIGFNSSKSLAYPNASLPNDLKADVIIIGGSLGGCAAALSSLKSGLKVILCEETDWLGGQLTSQGVPPDEHKWIEKFGCTRSYREFRNLVRKFYKKNYKLTNKARKNIFLNPGIGSVSRLCAEPKVYLECIESLLYKYIANKQLTVLKNTVAIAAELAGNTIRSVKVKNQSTNHSTILNGPIFIDSTELGDLLPMTGCEHVLGTEGKKATDELHMPEKSSQKNQQAFTMCFAMEHIDGENHTIDKPDNYNFWKNYIPKMTPPWPGKLLDFAYTHPSTGIKKLLGFNPEGPHKSGIINLWKYRRILAKENFSTLSGINDVSLVNWPQNDYLLGNLTGVSTEERTKHINQSKELSKSLLYWLQTEAPRDDGGTGWPGLRLRKDIFDTNDGMAKYPYVRESARIKAVTTILEQDCGLENRSNFLGVSKDNVRPKHYHDSVGIGHYQIDLHPTSEGDNYIDFPALPFELPLGSMIPIKIKNLIAGSKNIGTTHVTNGCYRLHPVEWNIGEVAGYLAAKSLSEKSSPMGIRNNQKKLESFQKSLVENGIELRWPDEVYSS